MRQALTDMSCPSLLVAGRWQVSAFADDGFSFDCKGGDGSTPALGLASSSVFDPAASSSSSSHLDTFDFEALDDDL